MTDVPDVFKKMLEIERDEAGNPMTLEGAIRSVILKNPKRVQWRDQAIEILYGLLGAGIEWSSEGRLVDRHPNNYMNLFPKNCGPFDNPDFGLDESMGRLLSSLPKKDAEDFRSDIIAQRRHEFNEGVAAVLQIEQRCIHYSPNRTAIYPQNWYGSRLCPPKNAQHDFLIGALEAVELVIASPVVTNVGASRVSSQLRSKQVAAQIRPALLARCTAASLLNPSQQPEE